jgi:hypothetical protein
VSQPLARIEGGLAIPAVLPFEDLPPLFGARRRRSGQGAGNPGARATRAPPGTLHILRYPTRPKRHDTGPFEAAMAEARAWLDADAGAPRLWRSDYLQGSLIALTGSIVLAWLLISSRAPETAPRALAEALGPVVEHVRSGDLRADAVALAARRPVQPATPLVQERTPYVVAVTPPVTGRRITARPALSGIRSAPPPGVTRPESAAPLSRRSQKTVPPLSADDELSRLGNLPAQWVDLSSQQPFASAVASQAAPIYDSNWNARLTQRRVTDIPDAFQAN